MRTQSTLLLLGTLALSVSAAPQPFHTLFRKDVSTGPACLPQDDPDPKQRAAGVASRDDGFVYGPSLIGEAAPFPNGTLGNARSQADMDLWGVDREVIDALIEKDVETIQGAIVAVSATVLVFIAPSLTRLSERWFE
jgi:hypothetical protein